MSDDKSKPDLERIDINDIPSTPIARTGLQLPHPDDVKTGPIPPVQARPQTQVVGGEEFVSADAFDAKKVQRAAPVITEKPDDVEDDQVRVQNRQFPVSKRESPTIKKLRRAFCVNNQEGLADDDDNHAPFTVRVGGEDAVDTDFQWTFRFPGGADINWALSLIGDDVLLLGIELMTRISLKRAMVAVSTAAIDGVPVYEHFGIQVPKGYHIPDPLCPPRQLRFVAARYLYEMLANDAIDEFTSALAKVFDDRIEPVLSRKRSPLVSTQQSRPSEKTQT